MPQSPAPPSGARRRPWRAPAFLSIAALVLTGLAAGPAQAATTTYEQASLSASVTGTTVIAKTTVKANPQASARYYGVCVRDSKDANLDFDKSPATITTAGTAYTSQAKQFPVGTYSYFPCVYDGSWHNVGAVKTFTVGSPATTTVSVTKVGTDSVTVAWTPTPGATGYLVGRDGTDSGGSGPWSTTDPASARSRTFLFLNKGTKYTFSVQALPGGPRQTVSATPGQPLTPPTPPTPPPPPAAPVSATVTQSGDSATIRWTSTKTPNEGWTVGRNGTDSGGSGPWSTTTAPTVREWTFLHLVKGQTYTLSVASSVGKASATVTMGSTTPTPPTPPVPPTPPTPPAPPTPGDTSPGWLSGVGGDGGANGRFGAWRGAPVEIGQTWINSPEAWTLAPGAEWGSFSGPMSVSLDPGATWNGWASVARGDSDAFWRSMAKTIAKYRQGKGVTYLSPYYEFNGDWMRYSVRPGEEAAFRDGFARISNILRQEFPSAKIVLPAACARDVPPAKIPASSSYDLAGCTIYNNWPWQADGQVAMQRLEVGRARAQAAGKPLVITEWASASVPSQQGGGGDGPGYMHAMHAWMAKNAGTGSGKLAFETFFNISNGYADKFAVWEDGGIGVSSTQRNAALAYQQDW